MNKRQQLLALHSLIPWPWNRLQPIFDYLTASPPFSKTAPKIPNVVRQKWSEASTFPFHFYYEQHTITPITIFDDSYPARLKELHDPPAVIYLRGHSELLEKRMMAIIGSRKATSYSNDCITQFMPYFKEQNWGICSGMAIGADTMAHEAALAHEINTVAVLGAGFQFIYPPSNRKLFERLASEHLVISEYPPHTAVSPHQFIARNRIISALSDSLLVTEAEKKSGTLSTVEFSLDLGKEIFTVPGRIDSPLSAGPHFLLQQGAHLLHSMEDLHHILGTQKNFVR